LQQFRNVQENKNNFTAKYDEPWPLLTIIIYKHLVWHQCQMYNKLMNTGKSKFYEYLEQNL